MVDRADINAVDDAAWEQAVVREAVIRRLASKASPNRAEFLKACRDLGLKRSRLYELISAYKTRPVASSPCWRLKSEHRRAAVGCLTRSKR